MSGGMEKMNIQWFPGHMTRAQRMIEENLKLVDAVCEILDARIPASSRNPDIDRLAVGKPRLVILNRCDLADLEATARWRRYFQAQGIAILETDARTGKGTGGFVPAVRELLKDKLADYAAKGQAGRPLRVMILGIPNVGKSTFSGSASTRALTCWTPPASSGRSSTARRWGRCWPSQTPSRRTCWTRRL